MPPRQIKCRECPHHKRSCFREMEESELSFIESFKQGELAVEPGAPIVLEEANSPHLFTVLKGWAFRYKTLPDGRRQILNYALPGGLIGLQASVFNEMSHGVEALTPMLLCVFSRDQIWTLYEGFPSLAFDVTWLAAREERLLDEHLLSVGQRTAKERLAHVLWHLFHRAEELGLTEGNKLDFPLTQQHLADTLGLSLVHTNKTLRRLRDEQCLSWEGRLLQIHDAEGLRRIAQANELSTQRRPFL
ncbi:Crp/Fnr family transcriptional regulator [Algihabitans albus]|uniref:Crp/Fnr family transcriptional regulator n=1 Tax=Algihabitans albus TaxID=2164067 RepID=UPI001ABC5C70|nr:Crp/Fnr family transcriptional regulator [Algihabitans albus]